MCASWGGEWRTICLYLFVCGEMRAKCIKNKGHEPGRDRDDGRRRVACGGGGWWWVCGGQLPTTTPTHDERCINAMINALGW